VIFSFLNAFLLYIVFAADVEPQAKAGIWNSIIQVFSSLLRLFHNLTNSWGLAIILFVIFTKLALLPLMLKQMRTMRDMQKLKPEIDKLQEKYKDDKQMQQTKMMELYKEHNVSLGAGCLPMLIQLPILLALYQAVVRLDEFNGAAFLWIKDLGAPDIPLVIITGIVMYFQMQSQQKMSGQAQQNQMMNLVYPFLIIFIGFKLPAGVVLYWAASNLAIVVQNYFVYRKKEPVEKEAH